MQLKFHLKDDKLIDFILNYFINKTYSRRNKQYMIHQKNIKLWLIFKIKFL